MTSSTNAILRRESPSSTTRELSRRSTWDNMSARRASLARLDSCSSMASPQEVPALQATLDAVLGPARLAALEAVDVPSVPYDTYSFFSYLFSIRGRNFPMLVAPLLLLLSWGLGWQLLFVYGLDGTSQVRELLATMDDLIAPLLSPLSFLLTFRLGRAAVRFWDARQAAGKMIEICRSNIATVSAGFMAPDDAEALELLCEYARWLTAFPIAVKHFLRPAMRKGWRSDSRYKKRRFEIGSLLSDEDSQNVIMEYDDNEGKPAFDPAAGTPARCPPLVVLNRLHELSYRLAHFAHADDLAPFSPTPQSRAIFYQQATDQLGILFGAFGTMERIKLTPLPFAYAIHLRTFLLLYLFLWNMSSVAQLGWISLPFLFLSNWALLGIEAAAVECERPFDYRENHLTLGKVSVVIARNIGQALKELVK
ncbi:hypothetical protein ACHAWF_006441 [Thalassiosira exigua]